MAARILEQLSLTAWLPASLLVANVYLLVGVRLVEKDPKQEDRLSLYPLRSVLGTLNENAWGIFFLLIVGVVLATLITQSLEYSSIRFLEGYWGGSALTAAPTALGTKVQAKRQSLVHSRADRVERRALESAMDWVRRDIAKRYGQAEPEATTFIDAVRAVASGELGSLEPKLQTQAESYFRAKTWMRGAAPYYRGRAQALSIRLKAFPNDGSRLLPTRLGNTMRSFEERLQGHSEGAKMRGYLYAHLHAIPPMLMNEHDRYRNRLDMYAVMTLLCAVLTPLNFVALLGILPLNVVASTSGAFALLSYFSYRGAISAALDYGPILLAIDAAIMAPKSAQTAA